jgi:AcrR family transcriptional regulator
MSAEAQKSYHHGDLKEALLIAAEQALADSPVEQVSLREIARRAGVSHAAPKHHFSTIGQLFGEVAARGFANFAAAISAAADASSDQSPASRLQAMSRAYIKFAADNAAVYGLMFGKRGNVVDTTPNLASSMITAWSTLENEVSNIIGPSRATLGAATVWSTVHGFAMLRIDRKMPPHVTPEAALEFIIRSLISGLKAEA